MRIIFIKDVTPFILVATIRINMFLWNNGTTLVVPNVKKIRGLNLPGTPWATSVCCGMTFTYETTQRQGTEGYYLYCVCHLGE